MATNTAASFTNHTGNGNTDSNGKSDAFPISFAYLAESEIDVTVGGVHKTLGTHYTIASSQITFIKLVDDLEINPDLLSSSAPATLKYLNTM